ncbi:MAG: TonB-dependent receptor [Pseudomonadota bacterium]
MTIGLKITNSTTWVLLGISLTLPLTLQAASSDDERFDFNIGAQPLAQALVEFGTLTRRQVSSDADAIRGLRNEAVRGNYTAEVALAKLLTGTGLAFSVVNGSSFALRQDPDMAIDQAPAPQPPRSSREIEEIVVKGELLSRSLQATQTSVSVVTGEQLDTGVEKDLFDLVDRLPGINQQGGGFGFVIRGITDGGVGGGSGQAISIQIDGASVPNGQALRTGSLSVWDLAQVEVLLGPQSTQQGPNSLAGAIVIRSQDPIFDNEFKARVDYGRFDETRLAGAANIVLSENWALRLSAEDFESDGDITNLFTGEDTNGEGLTTYRGKLRYAPTATFDAVLSFTHSENQMGDQSINDDLFPNRRVSNQGTSEEGTSESINLRILWSLNDFWRIESSTSFLDSDYDLEIVQDSRIPANTPGVRTVDDDSISQEIKLLYAGENTRAVTGLYYQEFEKDLFFEAFIPDIGVFGFPFPGQAVFGNTIDGTSENFAIFAEIEHTLNAQWTFIGGLRYDTEEQDESTTNFSVFTPDPIGLSASPEPVELDSDYEALLPKLGVVYAFNTDVSLGFTVQRGYRAGGAATDFQSGQLYDFDPEFTTNYEFSFRSRLAEGSVIFNANVFLTDYTDMQVSIPGPSGTFVDARIENAGESTLYGIEFLTEYRPNAALELYANVGYTKTKFDEYIGGASGASGAVAQDLSGNEFPQAPRLTGAIGGSYHFADGFFVDIDVTHTDDSYYTVDNLPTELNEPFTLVNARIGYAAKNWTAHLFGRNVLDEEYLARKRADGFSSAGDSAVYGISITANL